MTTFPLPIATSARARARGASARPSHRNSPDTAASFAHFVAGKSCRAAAKELSAHGHEISHNTIAALVRGDRLPCVARHDAVLHRLGGMMAPGTNIDRARRNDALALMEYTKGHVGDLRRRELVEDALTLLPLSLSGTRLPPGRRLTLGVSTLLVRDRIAGRDDRLRTEIGAKKVGADFLKAHGLDTPEGRSRILEETRDLADELLESLCNMESDRFLSGASETRQAEINGIRYLKHALHENWFGAQRAVIHNRGEGREAGLHRAAEAEAARRLVHVGYVETAAAIDYATEGWASWKLGNAFHIAILAGDYQRTLGAARTLAARFPNFHLERYGRNKTAKAAWEDPEVWIGLAVIRRLNTDAVGPLMAVKAWIDAPAHHPDHEPCVRAVRRLLEPDGLRPKQYMNCSDAGEFPRLMGLIDPFLKGVPK